MRAAFVATNPLDDIAVPLVAMTRGCKVEKRLAEHFGTDDIADLPLPFFCISADLASGEAVVHRRGNLATALRASIALPGVLPPVTMGDKVLVDGGVLRNLPTATLRADHDGTIVAVDVSHSVGLFPDDVRRPKPLFRWFRTGAWRRGPPIVSILMRSATIASGPDLLAAKAAADLYVMPEVSGIEIRDWRAYDVAVEAGRSGMEHALGSLAMPVSEIRRAHLAAAMIASPM
jgi:NTE family protein